jgi:hypothetical protein
MYCQDLLILQSPRDEDDNALGESVWGKLAKLTFGAKVSRPDSLSPELLSLTSD